MADVFISYAEEDRPLASKLAAMLEDEGWKV
jgi:TIR domain